MTSNWNTSHPLFPVSISLLYTFFFHRRGYLFPGDRILCLVYPLIPSPYSFSEAFTLTVLDRFSWSVSSIPKIRPNGRVFYSPSLLFLLSPGASCFPHHSPYHPFPRTFFRGFATPPKLPPSRMSYLNGPH